MSTIIHTMNHYVNAVTWTSAHPEAPRPDRLPVGPTRRTRGRRLRCRGAPPGGDGLRSRVIRIIGRQPGITQRQLADKLGALQSRVVALLDGLERKGLAERNRSTTDRRVQQLDLTDAGRSLLAKLRLAAEAQEAVVAEGLSDQQKGDLYQLLSTLSARRGLDADVHPGYRESGRA